ncbi:hypothetical protein JCM8547_005224 [Rhodosporidiobolus lusitaniae]
MDAELHYLTSTHDQPQQDPAPPTRSVPLPAVTLPPSPRPTLSPSPSGNIHRTKDSKQPRMSGGLDLSQPASPAGARGGFLSGRGGGAADGLDTDVARARAERAFRLGSRTLSSNGGSSSPSDDPRDSASARDNIQRLVNAGQQNGASGGLTPSLAMFMGGGGKRRVHHVNTGMTVEEREETEKLEREMAASRARWGDKGNSAPPGPPAGGLSLADIMAGRKSAAPAPAPAASPSPPPPAATSLPDEPIPATSPAPSSPPLVEAKIVSRSPPVTSPPASSSMPPPSVPSTGSSEFGALPTDSSSTPSSAPPAETATSPRLVSGATDTLTRLRSSSIVAERLKWGEEQNAASSPPASPALGSNGAVGKTSKEEKRRSVFDRWGKDSPSLTGEAALKSPPAQQRSWVSSSKTASSSPPHPAADGEKGDETKEKELERTASPATIVVGHVEQVDIPAEPVETDVPKLVHVTAGRARPTKSTPRTLSSAEATSTTSTPSSSSTPAPSSSPPPSAQPEQEKKGYTKPTWSGPPIGSKPPYSAASPSYAVPEEPQTYEPKYVRGPALPGMTSGALRPTPSHSPSFPAPSSPAPVAKKRDPPAVGGGGAAGGARPNVRSVAQRWSAAMAQQDEEAEREKEERRKAVKASYGVKVEAAPVSAPAPVVEMPVKREEARREEVRKEEKEEEPVFTPAPSLPRVKPVKPSPAPAPVTAAPSPSPAPLKPASLPTSKPSSSPSSTLLSLIHPPPPPPSSPTFGETLHLDVFHLNSSPSPNPHAIDHNFMLFRSEVLGVVLRSAPLSNNGKEGEGEVETSVWVWKGDEAEAEENEEVRERVRKFEEKLNGGKVAEVVRYGKEGRAFVEAFAGQVTVCRGHRDEFDHFAKRLYSIRSQDGVVFVEEVGLTANSICSGACATFSIAGEVFAWLGEGSNEAERSAACEFAESIADGRTVTVLAEGEETAWFWHNLDAMDYASAYYWRYRPSFPSSRVTVLHFPSSSSSAQPELVHSLELSPTEVSLIDGGFAEHWVVVPKEAREKKGEIERALRAAEELAGMWEERGFPGRTPFHVLAFPSLIPRDLPFLSRALDFSALNAGEEPTKMNVYTKEEAREELL